MKIDIVALKRQQNQRSNIQRSHHSANNRLHPAIWQYDYLALSSLAADIRLLLEKVYLGDRSSKHVLDVGCEDSPYRELLAPYGWILKTLDITPGKSVDYVGTVEDTGLPNESFDLILCTQVIEHCSDPWKAISELNRILRPGGHLIWSVPHAWFYHPHPSDFWRFTPEGVVKLSEEGDFSVECLLCQGGSIAGYFQVLNFCIFGMLGRLGSPVYLANNFLGAGLDKLLPNALFSLNLASLCRK